MKTNRSDTQFCLRYAVRVLERHARMWHQIDILLRISALFSGTAAFGALVSGSPTWTLVAGLFFALLHAIEYVVVPGDRERKSLTMRGMYAKVLATQHGRSDVDLEASYQGIVAEDEIGVPETLRRLAYNDVVEERGDDPEYLYTLKRWQRLTALIA